MGIKEDMVRKYISGINFNEAWSVELIQQDLKKILGETPGIKIDWKKDVGFNEGTGTAYEYKAPEKFNIVFTDDNDRFKKLTFLIDG